MALNIRYLPEIVDDREDLDKADWAIIESKIEEVREGGTSHEDVKLVPNSDISHPVWELKIEDENADHRVFLGVDSGTLVVLATGTSISLTQETNTGTNLKIE